MSTTRTYIAIDLKSFYASVECKERDRDPLTTNLVVADKSRTEKTICLAVSPSLKSYGIPGRPRLFEVIQKVNAANASRRWKAPKRTFTGASDDSTQLKANPSLEIDYIVAPPQMALYMEYSTRIYSVYLKYIAPEDIFPYSIDEVFIDATNYLKIYHMTGRQLAMTMIQDVLKTTGITATAGIGTNMYLCKIAMDIVAKHIPPDKDGVRIAELVKAYKPETNSVSSGQVLHCPYDYDKARLIVKEMTDQMVLDLVDKGLVTDQVVLTVGYDIENLTDPNRSRNYKGAVTIDRYGRKVPKHAHGTANLKRQTSSTKLITDAVMELYDRIVDKNLLVRRINITANKLVDEESASKKDTYEQLDLFTDYKAKEEENAKEEAATAKDRNEQIGGHKA